MIYAVLLRDHDLRFEFVSCISSALVARALWREDCLLFDISA